MGFAWQSGSGFEGHAVFNTFSYANASDVFSTGEVVWKAFVVGTIVLLGAVIGSFIVYEKKDLAV